MRTPAEGRRAYIAARAGSDDSALPPVPAWWQEPLLQMWMATTRHQAWLRRLLACLAVLLFLEAGGWLVKAQPPCGPSLEERQRYGFVALREDWATAYAVDTLEAGWYLNPVQPTPPHEGMDQTVVIRTPSGYTVDPATLGPLVDANPGVIWIIGSEPDCIWQDNVLPEEYARIYHDLYDFIKNRDEMSQIAAGGIVQPTPLRLEYLDRVLAEYQTQYGGLLPVDLWHIHNAILNEERGGWGADIPPGIEADQGVLRSIDDNDSIVIFQEQVLAFRQWMADRGYGGYSLIITEYGVLMPVEYNFDVARVNRFMTDTFAYLSTAADAALGDVCDNGQLVQRWAWFSLDERPWDPGTGQGFNGNLFDPDTTEITAHGMHFARLTGGLSPLYLPLILRGAVPGVQGGMAAAPELDSAVLEAAPTKSEPPAAQDAALPVWTAYPLPHAGSYPGQVALDEGRGLLWVTERDGDRVARLDLGTEAWQEYDLAPGSQPWGLAVDASGVVWFAESGLDRIGKLEASGALTEYEGLVPGSQPRGVAVGDDGVVWFTERAAGQLGRLEPVDGAVTEYELLTAGALPGGIAVHGDYVWVAETGVDRLGRFWIPEQEMFENGPSDPWEGTLINPEDVAVTSEGNPWLTDTGGDGISLFRFSTAQLFWPVPVPTAASEPYGITTSRSGAIWFTERAGNRVGWHEPRGSVVEYVLPTPGSQPTDVVADEQGCVWVAAPGANQVLHLCFQPGDYFTYLPLVLR